MGTIEDAAAQIAEEIDAQHIWPLESNLGPGEEFGILRQRAAATARMMAAQLASGDDKLAAQTAIDLASLILPDDIPDDFWATPLGRLIAKSAGHPSSDEVPYSVAAAMLGVSKTRVQQLVEAGKLERHPGGGITSVSVRLRAQGTA
ncbi:MAG TPA: hypothetical protein VL551_01540 [Actinospica sp.]|jgi:hypothetical protein|nr:hypothetical protein [Actinospica sp.]